MGRFTSKDKDLRRTLLISKMDLKNKEAMVASIKEIRKETAETMEAFRVAVRASSEFQVKSSYENGRQIGYNEGRQIGRTEGREEARVSTQLDVASSYENGRQVGRIEGREEAREMARIEFEAKFDEFKALNDLEWRQKLFELELTFRSCAQCKVIETIDVSSGSSSHSGGSLSGSVMSTSPLFPN